MPSSPRIYTRLTRRSSSVASYQSLWLAPDHILVITSTGYTEEYRRLRLRDIKGFFTIPSHRRAYWNLPWSILAAFSGIAMVNTLTSDAFRFPFVSGPLFLGAVIALIWNNVLGTACRTFVITGVQTAPLPSLKRRRKTRKVIAQLEPLIRAAQADLVSAPSENAAPSAAAAPTAPSPSP
jgi:hypothetical protein